MSGVKKTVKPRFWLIVIALFLISLVSIYSGQAKYLAHQAEIIAELEQQRSEIAVKSAELQRKIDFTYTDEYIIREAREKLGLVLEGEVLFESAASTGE